MTRPTVAERVKQVMATVLDLGVDAERLPNATPLYSATMQLDSLRLLHLITALEDEFGCQIDDEAVMSAELVDVGSIVTLVATQLGAARDMGEVPK